MRKTCNDKGLNPSAVVVASREVQSPCLEHPATKSSGKHVPTLNCSSFPGKKAKRHHRKYMQQWLFNCLLEDVCLNAANKTEHGELSVEHRKGVNVWMLGFCLEFHLVCI